ncbi:MAG: LOG family protein [Rhodospirillales bacterium]
MAPRSVRKKRARQKRSGPTLAYKDDNFLAAPDARPIRILAEYLEPQARFQDFQVADTVVFFGSARVVARDVAEKRLKEAKGSEKEAAIRDLAMSRYYEDACALARRLTEWSKKLKAGGRRFIVCTGGGPGIMEAANRGASEAKGINAGLNVQLPHEQADNPYITRELNFEFHYFFMRKFWFVYLAKAIVIFPGGFGTLDELFELLTLMQTRKLTKSIPIVLYGTEFWREIMNLEAMVAHGVIDAEDRRLLFETDSVDEAFAYLTRELKTRALAQPGGRL